MPGLKAQSDRVILLKLISLTSTAGLRRLVSSMGLCFRSKSKHFVHYNRHYFSFILLGKLSLRTLQFNTISEKPTLCNAEETQIHIFKTSYPTTCCEKIRQRQLSFQRSANIVPPYPSEESFGFACQYYYYYFSFKSWSSGAKQFEQGHRDKKRTGYPTLHGWFFALCCVASVLSMWASWDKHLVSWML